MAAYKGWNRAAVMRKGSVTKQQLDLSVDQTEHPTVSFAPNNQHGAFQQFTSPMKTIRKGLDSKFLYDLPDEYDPLAPRLEGKRITSVQLDKSQKVSIFGGEYSTTGDLTPDQRETADGSPAKRRKPAPAKSSRSTKPPASPVIQFWDNTKSVTIPQNNQEPQNKQSGPQLTAPPDPGKRATRRTKSSTLNAKGRRTGPFKVPTITKSSVLQEKESFRIVARSQFVTNHQGWTTTEDVVKLNSKAIAITKTTLDKLAAFRYNPADHEQSLIDPPTSFQPRAVESEIRLRPSRCDKLDLLHPSSDYSLIPSHNSVFKESHAQELSVYQQDSYPLPAKSNESAHLSSDLGLSIHNGNSFVEATWNNEDRSDPVTSGPLDKHQPAHNSASEQHSCHDTTLLPQQSDGEPRPTVNLNSRPAEVLSQKLILYDVRSQHNGHNIHSPLAVSDFDAPSSSEARTLNQMLDDAEITQQQQKLLPKVRDKSPNARQDHFGTAEIETDIEIHHRIKDIGTLTNMDTSEIEIPEPLPILPNQRSQIRTTEDCVQPQIPVQFERPDLDAYESIPNDVSKDFEFDEFDEGLDDSDLLGITSEAFIPETQMMPLLNLSDDGTSQSRSRTHFIPASPGIDACKSKASQVVAATTQASPKPFSLLILDPDLEDEFPMDDDDEEEMLRLPELIAGVTERFQTSPSLHYPFGNQSGPSEVEVYDSTLQFSPLRSKVSAVSTQNIADYPKFLHTDNHNAYSSPARCSQPRSEILDRGKEWSFIRPVEVLESAEMRKTSDPPSEHLRQAIIPKIEKRPRLSSPTQRTRRKFSDHLGISQSVVESTSGTIKSYLDDSHEYEPLNPFARPDFPVLMRDRCPVIGLSAYTFLRTCFRIGEMFKEGKRCNSFGQDAIIELFARVTFSSRESGTTTQHFQFADLWHDRPPFPNGVLMNYKITGLADTESKNFIDAEEKMVRCLGRLKRDAKNATGWLLHIITIRETDWEEVRYTKRIVSAGGLKSESTEF